VIVRKDTPAKGTGGTEMVGEVTDKVLEGGEVIKGTMRLVPTGPTKSRSNERSPIDVDGSSSEGQSPTPSVPSNKGETEDGTVTLPPAWANVWTTNDHVELWV